MNDHNINFTVVSINSGKENAMQVIDYIGTWARKMGSKSPAIKSSIINNIQQYIQHRQQDIFQRWLIKVGSSHQIPSTNKSILPSTSFNLATKRTKAHITSQSRGEQIKEINVNILMYIKKQELEFPTDLNHSVYINFYGSIARDFLMQLQIIRNKIGTSFGFEKWMAHIRN